MSSLAKLGLSEAKIKDTLKNGSLTGTLEDMISKVGIPHTGEEGVYFCFFQTSTPLNLQFTDVIDQYIILKFTQVSTFYHS